MIVYQATKSEFSDDVLADTIETKIHDFFKKHLNKSTSRQEIISWKNSLQYMDRVLNDNEIPDDCGVTIEYQLPQTAKRIDFILTGTSAEDKEYAILVELKQWSEATLSDKDGVINSFVGGAVRELPHPSYQAWSYATLLQNFNETVATENINLKPCAYLHNYMPDDVITNEHYQEYIDKAPVFLRGDAIKLRNFIKEFVKHGDKRKMIYRIEQGKIRPSKMLADSMVSLLQGNHEFVMIDDQKIVYETALSMSQKATANKKQVLIVKGGPGTGKSVVAINLLVEITRQGLLAQYVSKNAAPRAVYESKLTGTLKKTVISNLFSGSGAFINTKPNTFDTLIVDEAHRLNEKSGLYSNLGDHQIKEIINAARCSVFFIDEDQRVTLNDVGTLKEIYKWAELANAEIVEMELSSQFRCNGSDGYLAFLDHLLQIRETANTSLEGIDYDFRVFSNPKEMLEAIKEKNKINNKSRMVAGYCWEWASKKNPELYDVVIPDYDFKMRWNLTQDGSLWIISPESVNEIGCIHTCQGLEVDYVGVVIGPDLIVRDGKVLTQPLARARSDKSIFGYKKLLESKPEEGKATLRAIIKNTYRTLMTRGMKGCYVYCMDEETEAYFNSMMKKF
ncbi:MAG: AAA family ATPase [Bacteroidetes bacterium 46-16]|nr:MAG: AAA family ATPase [Bacteroidetes bacterium 46-16]